MSQITDEVRDPVLERFVRYVRFDTQSNEKSTSFPSTEKQLVLLRALRDELAALGLAEVEMDEWGYVFATIPATVDDSSIPTVGFIAHVDTSPEMSGAGVEPIVHRSYQGGEIALPDEPSAVLRPAEIPRLLDHVGGDLVTASGTTLLGADNKAGVAEIVTAAEYLLRHPEIRHGRIRLGFTPDEEVGRGAEHFDVKRFDAACAYTMDGESPGELECESFSADSFTVVFKGRNTHPGYAKGLMVNAIKVAGDFLSRLPRNEMSPETTSHREGFVHPYVIEGGVDRMTVKLLIRDFSTPALADKESFLEELAAKTAADWPGCTFETKVQESYRNMREVLDAHPRIVENAREGYRRAGLTVTERPIRGGTDGSRLSFMGLPTPNVFAGEHNFHSRLEWVAVDDMAKAVEVIVRIAEVWAERP